MTKPELVKAIATKTGATQTEVADFINAYQETVIETLIAGEDIKLVGFGNYTITDTKEHMGRNPQTGEPQMIPASVKIGFKFGDSVKKKVKEASK